VVDELTALAGFTDFRKLDEGFAATNRLRTEGTDHLLEGIRGLPFVGSWPSPTPAGLLRPNRRAGQDRAGPFDPDPPAALRRTVEAMRYLE
jgi:2-alkyl-3-oxoalkanoate reductase